MLKFLSRTPGVQRATVLCVCGLALSACQDRPGGSPGARLDQPAPAALCLSREHALVAAGDSQTLDALIALTDRPGAAAGPWIAIGQYWLGMAQQRSDPGFLLQARACAEIAREREPGQPDALALDAAAALGSHQFDQALGLAQEVLAIDSTHVAALGVASDAQLELGRYREAADFARRQMAVWPGPAAQARSAWLRWLRGDVEQAKRDLVLALRGRDDRTPGFNAWLWHELAQLLWQQGDLAGAGQLWRQALAQSSGFAPALLGQARLALAEGQAQVALQLARGALNAGAGLDAAILIGDVLSSTGDDAGAQAAWLEAERLGQRSDPLGLARFLAERHRDPQRALQMLEQVRADRPTVQVDAALAWALYRSGHCERAAAAMRNALRLGTQDARLWFQDGAIALRCGDAAHGERQLAAALALHPVFDPWLAQEAALELGKARRGRP